MKLPRWMRPKLVVHGRPVEISHVRLTRQQRHLFWPMLALRLLLALPRVLERSLEPVSDQKSSGPSGRASLSASGRRQFRRARLWHYFAVAGQRGSFEFSAVGAGYALDIVSGRAAGPGVRTTYLTLLTAAPTDTTTPATMTETTMTGYARQADTWTVPSGAPIESHNSNVMTFGPVTGTMATVSHFAIVSSSSGTAGDFLAWGALTTSRTPSSGDSLQAAASAFSLNCT